MSISTIQETIFKKGCGQIILGACAIVMVGGILTCNRYGNNDSQRGLSAVSLAEVGETPVTADEVQTAMSAAIAKASESMPGGTPGLMVNAGAAVNDGTAPVFQAAEILLAQQNGVNFTPETLKPLFEKEFAANIAEFKQAAISKKKLNANATDAEVAAAFKQQSGKTFDEYKQQQLTQLNAVLSDAVAGKKVRYAMAHTILMESYAKKYTLGDADLKALYDDYVVKRISFLESATAKETPSARAEKVLAELKTGAKFEDLINKYSDDVEQSPTRKKSDTIINVQGMKLDEMPGLKGKKAGEVTGILKVDGGLAIYKVIEVKNSAPSDFGKNLEIMRKNYASSKAMQQLSKDASALVKSDKVKWSSNGYHALVMLKLVIGDPTSQGKVDGVIKLAEEELNNPKAGDTRLAAFALYGAMTVAMNTPGAGAFPEAKQIEILEKVLPISDDYQERLKLADLYAKQNKGEKVAEQLTKASQLNKNYDATGQKTFGDLSAKALTYKSNKVVTDAQLATFYTAQDAWKSMYVANQKAAADAAKQAEETQKKNEELLKQQKASVPSTPAGGKGAATTESTYTGGATTAPAPTKP